MSIRKVAALLLVTVMSVPLPRALALEVAQQEQEQSVVSRSDIDNAMAAEARAQDLQRQRIRSLLDRPEVRELAGDLGLDLAGATEAVATLDGSELATLEAHAAALDDVLSGGASTITIGLVPLLLIVIIVILLAD
jgi:hypothetical protein